MRGQTDLRFNAELVESSFVELVSVFVILFQGGVELPLQSEQLLVVFDVQFHLHLVVIQRHQAVLEVQVLALKFSAQKPNMT